MKRPTKKGTNHKAECDYGRRSLSHTPSRAESAMNSLNLLSFAISLFGLFTTSQHLVGAITVERFVTLRKAICFRRGCFIAVFAIFFFVAASSARILFRATAIAAETAFSWALWR